MDFEDGSIGHGSIPRLAVVTKDRRPLLERCLTSFARDFLRAGRHPELTVFDDTAAPAERGETRAMLRRLGEKTGMVVRYSGWEQKCSYARELAREAAVSPETVAFALGVDERGAGTLVRSGANRNTVLLDCAGEAALLADDDMIAEPLAAPADDPPLAFCGGESPWQIHFSPNLGGARPPLRPVPGVLAHHEGLIGATLGACAERARKSPPWRHSMRIEPRVRVTVHGARGDSGWSVLNVLALFRHHREVFERTSPETILGRWVERTVPRITVSRGNWFQAMAFAIDNRNLLPPFLPVGRNQDGVFAHHLMCCFDDALIAYLPSTLLHEPPGRRPFDASELHLGPQRVRFCDLIMTATSLLEGKTRPSTTVGRLTKMGEHLTELAGLGAAEFRATLRQRLIHRRREALLGVDHLNGSNGLSERWSPILASSRKALGEGLEREDFGTPEDLNSSRDADQAWLQALVLFGKFGRLLTSWAALVTAARTLRQRDVRPTVRL